MATDKAYHVGFAQGSGGSAINYGFKLRTDLPNCYVPHVTPKPVLRNDIPGSPGDLTLTPQFYEWRFTDWSGGEIGELNPFFNPADPSSYDQGLINPRIPGQIAGPPLRTASTPTAAASIPTFGPFLGINGGYVWLCHGTKVQYSNATPTPSWTVLDTTALQVTCPPCTDGRFLYVSIHDTPGLIGTMKIRRYAVGGAVNDPVVNIGPNAWDNLGIAYLTGKLYRWTGLKLREFDIASQAVGAGEITTDGTVVYNVGGGATLGEGGTSDQPVIKYGGCATTDNSVVFFNASPGQTGLFEFKANVGQQLHPFINGFTAKAICAYLGNVWLVGQQSGQGCIWRYDLLTRGAAFVRWLRRTGVTATAMDPVSCAPGPENQILIGCSAGENFVLVWDPDTQLANVSSLDTRTGDGTENAVIAWTDLRFAAMGKGSVTVKVSSWASDDTVATTVQNGNVTSAQWDYDLPEEGKKLLDSIHVAFKPITGSETIIVSYNPDGAGFTALATITSATTGAATGDVRQSVSTATASVTFRSLTIKVAVTGGAIVKAVSPRMYPIAKDNTWDLLLDFRGLADPDGQQAWKIYTLMFGTTGVHTGLQTITNGLLAANNVVSFRNGFPYLETGEYDSYTAVIETSSYDAQNMVASVRVRSLA